MNDQSRPPTRNDLAGAYRENQALFVPEPQVWAHCDMLMDLHAWSPACLTPRDWIENFETAERPFALLMLHRFIFFPDHMTNELLGSAFHSVSNEIVRGRIFNDAVYHWQTFRRSALLTYVTGEQPNPTDSGYLFARKARDFLGFNESDIVFPDEAVRTLSVAAGAVVFVDDFVGSGNQFCATWTRKTECPDGSLQSFKSLAASGQLTFAFYCNALSTRAGLNNIALNCGKVVAYAGNVISENASFVGANASLWPDTLRDMGSSFIKGLNSRYGFTAEDGGEDDWRGFHKLGLGIAFAHSTPDATLPIFHSSRNGWRPLVRRT